MEITDGISNKDIVINYYVPIKDSLKESLKGGIKDVINKKVTRVINIEKFCNSL